MEERGGEGRGGVAWVLSFTEGINEDIDLGLPLGFGLHPLQRSVFYIWKTLFALLLGHIPRGRSSARSRHSYSKRQRIVVSSNLR